MKNKTTIKNLSKTTIVFLVVAFLFLLNANGARAEKYETKSCSLADVQAAINLSKEGDAVVIPAKFASQCDWKSIKTLNIKPYACFYVDYPGVTSACDQKKERTDGPASFIDYVKSDKSIFQLLIIILLFFAFFYFISKLEEEKKKRYFLLVLNLSPVWLTGLVLFVVSRVYAYASGQIDVFWDSLAIVAVLFLLLPLYYTMAVWPAASAHWIIKIVNDESKGEKKRQTLTLWSMLSRIKWERWAIIIVLALLIISFFLLDTLLLYKFNPLSVFQAISLAALFFYVLFKFFSYGRVDIPRTSHRKAADLKNAIDKLAITTGVMAPAFQILAHDNPTAFSIYSNFGKPTIYITASLLNIANKDELEAVVAHEFAHIYSGRILYLKRLYNLLIILKTLGFFMLFLVFIAVNPYLFFLWAALLFPAAINPSTDRDIVSGESRSIVIAHANVFNPPYALVNFISYLIYYSIAWNEEYYNDLKTVEFTRYPEGIYSIIKKIENYQGAKGLLPKKYDYLYFTGQDTIFSDIPAPQPPAENRESNLEQIDNVLADSKKYARDGKLICPYCQNLMAGISVEGYYCNPLRANYCGRCDSFWFDGWAFWSVWNFNAENIGKINPQKPAEIEVKNPNKMDCPRCGVQLELHADKELVPEINIWRCQICNGNWLSRKDAIDFFNYRRKLEKEKKEAAKDIAEEEELAAKQLIGSQSPAMLLIANRKRIYKGIEPEDEGM